MSSLFAQTLRDAPADAELRSHQLLVRAGYVRQLGAGIFTALPLARRVLTRIENIMRAEMNAIGGQELTMPVVHPAERDMVLAMTHEEVVTALVRDLIRSYRQLPALVYQIQTKWRDELRFRGGLIRVREFTMKDSYSLDADAAGLDRQYQAHYQAYFNIFRRAGLDAIAVESDVGMMGGQLAHEFMFLSPVGEDTLVLCDGCGYTANRQVARFRKPAPDPEAALPVEPVATPDTTTIAALAERLGIARARTAKAVFLVATLRHQGGAETETLVFAVVRGDMELNETKLANALGATALRPAREEEIRAIGAVPGYAAPVGVRAGTRVVVDDLIPPSPNLVAGANRVREHLRNVNYGRDYVADLVADIVAAEDGHACSRCGGRLRTARGVEVGNIFKLGTRYSDAMGATFLDRDGTRKPVVMGSYGIGSGRLLACVAEAHNDERGLCWPITVAPFPVHIVALKGGAELAERLHAELASAGIEALLDDRHDLSPGVRFADADLLGIPLRLTLGERGLRLGQVELKRREAAEPALVPLADAVTRVQSEIAELTAAVLARVRTEQPPRRE